MTADVNFDFQSRPVITHAQPGLLWICIIGFGALALNPAHRRANSQVFSGLQRTTRGESHRDVPRVAISSGHAPCSLLPGSKFDRLLDKSNCRQSISCSKAPFPLWDRQTNRTTECQPEAVHWRKQTHRAPLDISIPDWRGTLRLASPPENGPRLCN